MSLNPINNMCKIREHRIHRMYGDYSPIEVTSVTNLGRQLCSKCDKDTTFRIIFEVRPV